MKVYLVFVTEDPSIEKKQFSLSHTHTADGFFFAFRRKEEELEA